MSFDIFIRFFPNGYNIPSYHEIYILYVSLEINKESYQL